MSDSKTPPPGQPDWGKIDEPTEVDTDRAVRPPRVEPPPLPARGVDRFELRGLLGSGAMGDVYRAVDRRSGREVAVKLLRHDSGRHILGFKREFRAVSHIVHPNLVRLHELHTDVDRWFFTMDLVDGVRFIDWVRPAGALDPARLRAALVQLADGVLALHVCNKLHRDLKPSNVLVSADGRVVLLDFGLASDVDASRRRGADEPSLSGTPAYMSPEQASLAPLGHPSDWYAVGVMLYEALTGQRPFSGSVDEILLAKQTRAPEPPRTLTPDVPADLEALCIGLCARDPAERPDAARIFAALAATPSPATRELERTVAARPFVGRAAELDALQQALADSRTRGVTVFVSGESGIGKTQLVQQFLDDAGDDLFLLQGRCYEREAVPFRALDTVIDSLATTLARLPEATAPDLVPAGMAAAVRLFPVLRNLPALASVGELPGPAPAPQELRSRAFDALRTLLARLAALRPVVLVIDDIQWGDPDSAIFLADLAHHRTPLPILSILVHRNEDDTPVLAQLRAAPADLAGGDVRTLALGPLSPEEARQLVQRLGASDESAELVAREAGGHPLFLAELTQTGTRAEAPPTLDALIAARIARLPPAAATLLHTAAIAARPVPLTQAARAGGVGDGNSEIGLLRAERLLRVRQASDGETQLVEPYHDRVRAAVVAALGLPQRRALHAALARDYEAHQPGDLDALVAHWLGADEPVRAAGHAAEAGRAAEAALAFHRAADLYGLALRHAPLSADERRALSRRHADMLTQAGRLDEAAAAYAVAAAHATGDEALDLERLRLEQLLRAGHLQQGLGLGRRLLERIGVELPTSRLAMLAEVARQRLRTRLRGLEYVERSESALPVETLRRIDLLGSLASSLALVDPALGIVVQGRLVRAALDAGEPRRVCYALAVEAAYLGHGGLRNQRRIDTVAARARTLAARFDDPASVVQTMLTEGLAAMQTGRWRQARQLLDAGLHAARDHGAATWMADTSEHFHLTSLFYLGETSELARLTPLRLRAAVERGDVYAERGLRGWRSNLTWLILGQPREAREHVLQAEAGVESTGRMQMRDYFTLASHVRIDLYLGQGRQAWARLERAWPALRGSSVMRVQSVRLEILFVRAAAALAHALDVGAGAARRELAIARRLVAQLVRERVPWAAGFVAQLQAMMAIADGESGAAAAALGRAERAYVDADMSLYAAVMRLHRATLVGGGLAAAEVEATRAMLRNGAVVDPDALAQALCPWPDAAVRTRAFP